MTMEHILCGQRKGLDIFLADQNLPTKPTTENLESTMMAMIDTMNTSNAEIDMQEHYVYPEIKSILFLGGSKRNIAGGEQDSLESSERGRGVQQRVSFETYLSSRWSNGSARMEQPLVPVSRR